MTPPDMLSTGQVARAMGVTINTVKSWIRQGIVDAIRLPSGHHRIPRAALDRLRHEERWKHATRAEASLPVDERSLSDTLAWASSMLSIARSHGGLSEPPIEETVLRLRELRRALARVR